jgi:cytochrome c-type biogenesis protein CcmH
MVDQLAARMQQNPNDAEGWTMLARSYAVLGRYVEALPAYARANELRPNDAQLLADYADTAAATKRTANNPLSVALVERALQADPSHPKALALAGTIAYERGDYAAAIRDWQKIADKLPPESELFQRVQASIADARERATAARAAPAPPGASGTNVAAAGRPASAPTSANASRVSGVVTLDPALAAQAAPGDAVFVFARPASGGRMPLAVLRASVKDLPLSFTLDDSMAMAPGMTLSSAAQVTVGARISKSGNAVPQPGDLSGEVTGVTPGASNLAVRIGSIVGKP